MSVARAASQMQMVPGENKVIDSQDTYNVMMRVLLETNASIADQISASYHMVDYAFLQKLDQRAESETDEKVAARAAWSKCPGSQPSHGHPPLQKPARLRTAALWAMEECPRRLGAEATLRRHSGAHVATQRLAILW